MASWFYRGLRRGVVTTRYPRGPLDPWTQTLPAAPAFHSAQLTRELVRELADVCPAGALTSSDHRLTFDLGKCTACGRCLLVGGGAVTSSGEFLLAARDRSSLIKHIPIAGDGGRDGHA